MADRAHHAGALSYDPAADVALRHPDWVVAPADLGGLVPEVLCWQRKVILIEAGDSPEVQRSSLAHAIAHLDLGHVRTLPGFFESREEVAADRLAASRLVSFGALAEAVAWTADREAVARELGIDLPMLAVRESMLSRQERRSLRRRRSSAAAYG